MKNSETQPDADRGVYRKYHIERVDGSSAPGRKHHGCAYFVLDLDHDPFARVALGAYAAACAATHPALARDLQAVVLAPVPAQELCEMIAEGGE